MSALAFATPASTPADPRIVWDRLMGAYEAARAADEDINARYDAAAAAFEADKPAEPDINMVLLFGSLLGRCKATRWRLLYTDDVDELQRRILAEKGVSRWERIDRDPERIAELDKVREFRRLLAEAEQRHDISRRIASLGPYITANGPARNAAIATAITATIESRTCATSITGPAI